MSGMNKYLRTPDYVLDLHGRTIPEVEILLDSLFSNNAYKHVRIITGKGTHSRNGTIVRPFVKEYLLARGIRFNQAKIHDGGEGALDVFLCADA
jgi:DNA-nicking Smr family endonuclease